MLIITITIIASGVAVRLAADVDLTQDNKNDKIIDNVKVISTQE